jgi:ribosome-associated protein
VVAAASGSPYLIQRLGDETWTLADPDAGGILTTEVMSARAERMREVEIRVDVIRLGQFLKLAGLADSGAHAKALLEQGAVTVDGIPESRRGRQLQPGTVVAVGED